MMLTLGMKIRFNDPMLDDVIGIATLVDWDEEYFYFSHEESPATFKVKREGFNIEQV